MKIFSAEYFFPPNKPGYLGQPEPNPRINSVFKLPLQFTVMLHSFPVGWSSLHENISDCYKCFLSAGVGIYRNKNLQLLNKSKDLKHQIICFHLVPVYFAKAVWEDIKYFSSLQMDFWIALFITMYAYFACELLFTRVTINIHSAFLPVQSWRRVFTLS